MSPTCSAASERSSASTPRPCLCEGRAAGGAGRSTSRDSPWAAHWPQPAPPPCGRDGRTSRSAPRGWQGPSARSRICGSTGAPRKDSPRSPASSGAPTAGSAPMRTTRTTNGLCGRLSASPPRTATTLRERCGTRSARCRAARPRDGPVVPEARGGHAHAAGMVVLPDGTGRGGDSPDRRGSGGRGDARRRVCAQGPAARPGSHSGDRRADVHAAPGAAGGRRAAHRSAAAARAARSAPRSRSRQAHRSRGSPRSAGAIAHSRAVRGGGRPRHRLPARGARGAGTRCRDPRSRAWRRGW